MKQSRLSQSQTISIVKQEEAGTPILERISPRMDGVHSCQKAPLQRCDACAEAQSERCAVPCPAPFWHERDPFGGNPL